MAFWQCKLNADAMLIGHDYKCYRTAKQESLILIWNKNKKPYGAYPYQLTDYGSLVLYGSPKTKQTLDEVKELLLQQIDSLKKGRFPNSLLTASINNLKLSELKI